MRIVCLMGPPGSGKSSVLKQVASELSSFTGIHVGETLRKSIVPGGPLAEWASTVVRGEFIPDAVFLPALAGMLLPPGEVEVPQIVIEGMPRTEAQINWLNDLDPSWSLVVLDATDDVLVARLRARFECESCGPQQSEPCPTCGRATIRREDDTADSIIASRIRKYREVVEPNLAQMTTASRTHVVDASGDLPTVSALVVEALHKSLNG